MRDGFNFARLKAGILSLSNSQEWPIAKLEWSLWQVYQADEPDTCLCGHNPILEICVLKNRKNGNFAEVGNVCVNKFMGIQSTKVFNGIKRIQDDISKSVTVEALVTAKERGFISARDESFYLSVRLKRSLSGKQESWKIDINNRILAGLRRMPINQ
jgi:hypothetical protein